MVIPIKLYTGLGQKLMDWLNSILADVININSMKKPRAYTILQAFIIIGKWQLRSLEGLEKINCDIQQFSRKEVC